MCKLYTLHDTWSGPIWRGKSNMVLSSLFCSLFENTYSSWIPNDARTFNPSLNSFNHVRHDRDGTWIFGNNSNPHIVRWQHNAAGCYVPYYQQPRTRFFLCSFVFLFHNAGDSTYRFFFFFFSPLLLATPLSYIFLLYLTLTFQMDVLPHWLDIFALSTIEEECIFK